MKVECNGYDLADAVNKVIKAIGAKTVSPVLEGIKLTAENGSLKLTATDLELAIEKTIPADTFAEGVAVVPGRLFSEFVKKLNTEHVQLNALEGNMLKIYYRDSLGEINCLPYDEYPVIKELSDASCFAILGKHFRDLINKVSFCVSSDESRPLLKGVLLSTENDEITAVATDGYRLAKYIKNLESSDGSISSVVPARSLNEISRLIEDGEMPVKIAVQKNYLSVDLNHTRITTRVLEGNYINYKQIIPQNFETTATLSKDLFSDSLERAILLARSDRNNLVKFDMHEDIMDISSNSEAGKIDEHLNIKLIGRDLAIAFNARYFTELIKFIDTECISVFFNDAVQPCIVVPTGSTEDLLYLVLPVRMM